MNDSTKPLSKVIRIDESEIRGHLDEMVRGTVNENWILQRHGYRTPQQVRDGWERKLSMAF